MTKTQLSLACVLALTSQALLFTWSSAAQSTNDKAAQRGIERREQAQLDSLNHQTAQQAVEQNMWAFETQRMTDGNGRPVDFGANPRPNVMGFDGSYFYADVFGEKIESKATLESKKVNKKGTITYKYLCMPPSNAEAVLTLSKDSDFATLVLRTRGGTGNYSGKIIPLSKSQYFLQRGNQQPGMPNVQTTVF